MRTSLTTGELTAFLARPAFRALEGVARQLGVRLPAATSVAPSETMPAEAASEPAPVAHGQLATDGTGAGTAAPMSFPRNGMEAGPRTAAPRVERAAVTSSAPVHEAVAREAPVAPRAELQGPAPAGVLARAPVPPAATGDAHAPPPSTPRGPAPLTASASGPLAGTFPEAPAPKQEAEAPTRGSRAPGAARRVVRLIPPAGVQREAPATAAPASPLASPGAPPVAPPTMGREAPSAPQVSVASHVGEPVRASIASLAPEVPGSVKSTVFPPARSTTPLHQEAPSAHPPSLAPASHHEAASPAPVPPSSLAAAPRHEAASPAPASPPSLAPASRHEAAPPAQPLPLAPTPAPATAPEEGAAPAARAPEPSRRVVRLLSPATPTDSAPVPPGASPRAAPSGQPRARLTFASEAPASPTPTAPAPGPQAPAPQRDAATLRLGEQVTRGMTPVLEQAHQVTHSALTVERASTPPATQNAPASGTGAAVRNTFNVNVHLDPANAQAGLDRRALEDALVDILRETARRHGLEV